MVWRNLGSWHLLMDARMYFLVLFLTLCACLLQIGSMLANGSCPKHSTPVGQAIGLATHTLYSPDSEVGLIVVGVMNAISAGLLTFASLVELLSEDFLSDESWRLLHGKRRIFACLLVFAGAFLMSLVGAWA